MRVQYAGFWLRFVATIIDSVVIGIVNGIITMIFTLSMNVEDQSSYIVGQVISTVISVILNWLYSAYMESSSTQATLGKMALGLKVTDLDGERISFGRASARFFCKYISGALLAIGYIMAGFTARKQALHDMIAATLVVKKASETSPVA